MTPLREKIRELYCKWCPKDCQNLTRAERLGCLASGGFAEELESLGYRRLDKVLKWLDEPCVHTAWNTAFDSKLHYKDGAGLPCYLHRKDCPKCWQRALAPEQKEPK